MAASGVQCTVFGYDSALDWRPTVFLNAFPPTRVCSVCDLVPSTVALLPCHHVLCPRCYDSCCEGGRCKCPLDKAACEQEDLVWSTFTQKSLLERPIQCWNAGSGCNAAGPASEIIAHFAAECKFHAVTCKRCGRNIVHGDIVNHREHNNCEKCFSEGNSSPESVIPSGFPLLESLQSYENRLEEGIRLSLAAIQDVRDAQVSLDRNVTAVAKSAAADMSDLIGDIKTTVTSTSRQNTETILAACVSTSTGVYALKTNFMDDKQETGRTLKALKASVEASMAEMKNRSDEMLSIVRDVSQAILQNKFTSSTPLEWTIDGWSKLREEAHQEGTASHFSEKPAYFYGYSILPGAEIVGINGVETLRFTLNVQQGIYDEILTWPLKKQLHFKVIHPTDKEKVEVRIVDSSYSDASGLGMPTNPGGGHLFAPQGIKVQSLETNGYIKDDKILLKFEVSRSKHQ